MTALQRLDLERHRLTQLPVDIGNLVNLKSLRLDGNPLSEEEKARLREALPDCHIIF